MTCLNLIHINACTSLGDVGDCEVAFHALFFSLFLNLFQTDRSKVTELELSIKAIIDAVSLRLIPKLLHPICFSSLYILFLTFPNPNT